MLPAMPEPTSPRDLLDTPPFEEPLEEVLAARPPRAKLPTLTLCLGAGAVAVAGFVAGIHADKRWGGDRETAPAAVQGQGGFPGRQGGPGQAPSGFPGRQGGPGQGPGGFPGGGATTGTVSEVSGGTVKVKTPDGRTVEVTVTDRTRVTAAREGTVEDIEPGASVTVRGDQITVTPAR